MDRDHPGFYPTGFFPRKCFQFFGLDAFESLNGPSFFFLSEADHEVDGAEEARSSVDGISWSIGVLALGEAET